MIERLFLSGDCYLIGAMGALANQLQREYGDDHVIATQYGTSEPPYRTKALYPREAPTDIADILSELITPLTISESGCYMVRFFRENKPYLVLVDDRFCTILFFHHVSLFSNLFSYIIHHICS